MPKPNLSPDALKVLNKALKAIREYPTTVYMDDWIRHDDIKRPSRRRPEPYCGTVACLAGHVFLAATGKDALNNPWDTDWKARTILGITDHQAGLLFYRHHWPERFQKMYRKRGPARDRANAVIARVRYWLRTGK